MSDSVVRRLLPVIIGMVLTGALLVALGYISKKRREVADAAAPQLTIVQPLAGAVVDSPLVIGFTSSEPMVLQPTGWGTGKLHLHALVNGVEYMPAAAEITAADSLYFWTLTSVRRGRVHMQLGWADQRHRPIATGASDTVSAVLR